MAADWIKMRHDLADDPAVVALAGAVGISRQHAIGCLHAVWSWFDRHTENGCNAPVTLVYVDELAGVKSFGENLKKVGWLRVTERGISVPKFDRHNSQSAKRRAVTNKRVVTHRKRQCNSGVTRRSLPEKSREEKSKTTPLTPSCEEGEQGLLRRKGKRAEAAERRLTEAAIRLEEGRRRDAERIMSQVRAGAFVEPGDQIWATEYLQRAGGAS